MKLGRVHWIAGAACIVAVAAGLSAYFSRQAVGRERTFDAELMELDPAARTVVVKFTHPRTGSDIRISAEVPQTCAIAIDGISASLADLRSGDRASVQGTLYRSGAFVPKEVNVRRSGAANLSSVEKPAPKTP